MSWTNNRTLRRAQAMLAVVAMVLTAVVPSRAANPSAKEVPASDRIGFDQEKATANMRELEERMFRLAELTRETEPDDSARLLLAVRKAREELITEQMREVKALIEKGEFARAIEGQKIVITKLEELRDLLLSQDLQFKVDLDTLKKINEALKGLEGAIKSQTDTKGKTDKLSADAKAGKPSDPKEGEKATGDQKETTKATEGVAKKTEQIGPQVAKATEALKSAGKDQKNAESKMGDQKPGEASESQGGALSKMNDAKKELENKKKELQEKMKSQIAKQVMDALQAMLDQQTKIRETTESLSPKAATGNREAVLGIQKLGPPEEKIAEMAEQTIQLIEETEFSVALPSALGGIRRQMSLVAIDLTAGRGGTNVIDPEKAIEADLASLLAMLKDQDKKEREQKQQNKKDGECQSCKNDKNKLLTELRILRMMQQRVNDDTLKADTQRGANPLNVSEASKAQILDVKARQGVIRDAMDKLHRSTCQDCLK